MILSSKSVLFYAMVFALTFGYILSMKFPYQITTSSFDPYYHTAHARAYLTDEPFHYPQLTYFKDFPSDPWYGYHHAIAAVFSIAPNLENNTLIRYSIIFHAILSSLLVVVFAWFLKSYFQFFVPYYQREARDNFSCSRVTKPNYQLLIIGALTYTLLLIPNSGYRILFTERPHLIMIMLVVLGYIALLKRKDWCLLILGFLAPLFYSLSLFIFLPALITFAGWLTIDRSKKNAGVFVKPTIFTLVGFIAGILIHPQTLGYLINGVGFHTYAVLQSMLAWLPGNKHNLIVPSEMMNVSNLFQNIFLALGIITTIGILAQRLFNSSRSAKSPAQIIEIGTIAMTTVLSIATLFIVRLTEYSILLIATVVITFVSGYMVTVWPHFHEELKVRVDTAAQLYTTTHRIIMTLVRNGFLRRVFQSFFILTIVLVSAVYLSTIKSTQAAKPYTRSSGAIEFVSQINPSGLVMSNLFEQYTKNVFFAPQLKYTIGFDSRMTFFYDPNLNSEITHFWGYTVECIIEQHCTPLSPDSIPAFFYENNIEILLVDTLRFSEQQKKLLDSYSFLGLVYTDPVYPEILVYKVKYRP